MSRREQLPPGQTADRRPQAVCAQAEDAQPAHLSAEEGVAVMEIEAQALVRQYGWHGREKEKCVAYHSAAQGEIQYQLQRFAPVFIQICAVVGVKIPVPAPTDYAGRRGGRQ